MSPRAGSRGTERHNAHHALGLHTFHFYCLQFLTIFQCCIYIKHFLELHVYKRIAKLVKLTNYNDISLNIITVWFLILLEAMKLLTTKNFVLKHFAGLQWITLNSISNQRYFLYLWWCFDARTTSYYMSCHTTPDRVIRLRNNTHIEWMFLSSYCSQWNKSMFLIDVHCTNHSQTLYSVQIRACNNLCVHVSSNYRERLSSKDRDSKTQHCSDVLTPQIPPLNTFAGPRLYMNFVSAAFVDILTISELILYEIVCRIKQHETPEV